MKIVPSEFSSSAWNYFIFAKEIAHKNHQQDVDSDNLLLALAICSRGTKPIKIKAVIPYVGHAKPSNNPDRILKRTYFKKFKLLIFNFVKV